MAGEARLTVGQAFAARWIAKNYDNYRDRGTPEDMFEKISTAVDVYVDKQQRLLLSRLRDVAVNAADGKETNGEVSFNSAQILLDQALVDVARPWSSNSFTPVTRFPV